MCRTVHAVLQTAICGIQMLVRVFMTVILMIENLIRMILQTIYNFISFLLQMLSLIPICVVFLLTARLKCFMCGGGGPCPVNRGGACDCIMSALAIIILFFIFRATGVLDKIFYSLGYTKAKPQTFRFVPTPGDITECSRNDTDYTEEISSTLGEEGLSDTDTITDTMALSDLYTLTFPYTLTNPLYLPTTEISTADTNSSSSKDDEISKWIENTTVTGTELSRWNQNTAVAGTELSKWNENTASTGSEITKGTETSLRKNLRKNFKSNWASDLSYSL